MAGALLTSCKDITVQPVPVETIEITGAGSVDVGSTLQLTATPKGLGRTLVDRSVAWSSSNTDIATVDGSGTVRGVAAGSARITATIEQQSQTTDVTVIGPRIQLGPSTVRFVAAAGATDPDALQVQVTSSIASAPVSGLTARITYPAGQSVQWLTSTLGSTTTPATLTLRATTGTLPAGTHTATVSIESGSASNSPQTLAVTFDVTPPVHVSAGLDHSCALGPTGTAYCWGWNVAGQLGDGTLNNGLTPVTVAGSERFRMLEAGRFFSCGITTTDRVFCWGLGREGALGSGITDEPRPRAVDSQLTFRQLSVGYTHSCALTPAGEAYCWGLNGEGELGTGAQSPPVTRPAKVQGNHSFSAITVGREFTCALNGIGEAFCWGRNDLGQLGDNTVDRRTTPTRVATTIRFGQIDAGMFHTCGVAVGGTVHCWGENTSGKLGRTGAGARTPQIVAGAINFGRVSAGANHTCGLSTAGQAYCWGSNVVGELGIGPADPSDHPAPNLVPNLPLLASISAGLRHTCGMTGTGTAWCWGSRYAGALGDGRTSVEPQPVPVTGGIAVTSMAAGFEHTCARDAAGTGWCWGRGFQGVLGNGARISAASPTRVGGSQSFRLMAAAADVSCGVTTTADVYCWGSPDNGTGGEALTPARLAGIALDSIDGGMLHVCGIAPGGQLLCWGNNFAGQFGDGTTTSAGRPVTAAGGIGFRSVAAGAFHSCGVAVDGTTWCWGTNTYGELGDGSVTQSLRPVRVNSPVSFVAVAAGLNLTCGLTATNDAYCWGFNGSGQLGRGFSDYDPHPVPQPVLGGHKFTALASKLQTVCGRTTGNQLFCWGSNSSEQVVAGNQVHVPTPQPRLTGVLSFTVGAEHVCAVAAGTVCWGSNVYGNLGGGTSGHSGTPVTVPNIR